MLSAAGIDRPGAAGGGATGAVAARQPETEGRCQLLADATGVRLTLVEMLRALDPKMHVLPAVISAGTNRGRLL